MTSRALVMPLGERAANALHTVKDADELEDVSLLGIRSSYELVLKTPLSSGASSCSSINTDGSGTSAILSDIVLSSSSAKSSAFSVSNTATVDSAKSEATSSSSVQNTPQSSPLKVRSRVPTLDAIAARMRRGDGYMRAERQHASSESDQENVGTAAKPNVASTQHGRSEAIASLVHRTSNRSRSTSPVKKSFVVESDTQQAVRPSAGGTVSGSSMNAHSSPIKEVPTLQDIIKRISSKKEAESASSSPDLRNVKPPSTPVRTQTATVAQEAPLKPAPTVASSPAHATTKATSTVLSSPAQTNKAKKVLPKLALPKPEEHPLEHTWSLFFDSKSWNPSSCEAPRSPMSGTSSSNAQSWEAALKLLGQYNTVEGFMTVFRTLRRPSQLERNSNYHLFKNGIKPMWEDPANVDGGKWIITLRAGNSALLDRSWMWLVMALIGEELDEQNDVTGAVVSTRAKGDRIALWLRNKNDVELVNKIGRRFASLMDLEREPGVSLEFTPNNRDGDISAGPTASFATTQYYSFHNGMPTPTQQQGRAAKLTGSTSCSGQMFALGNPFSAESRAPPSVPASPVQPHTTLGAHLRLHGSPAKLSSSSSSTSMLNNRSPLKTMPSGGRTTPRNMRRSDSENNLSTSRFAMGVGTVIGRTVNSSPVPPSRTAAFGLMNRTKV